MNTAQRQELVDKLAECPSIEDQQTRDQVVAELPDQINENIRRDTAIKTDVAVIVRTCLNYANGLEALIADYSQIIDLGAADNADQLTVADLILVELSYLERGLLYANVLGDCVSAAPDLEHYLQGTDLSYEEVARTSLERCR